MFLDQRRFLLLIPVIALLAACTSPPGSLRGEKIRFNVAEASGQRISSFNELSANGIFADAEAAYYWSLNGGRGFVGIVHWQKPPFPAYLNMETETPELRQLFEEQVAKVLKQKTLVKKAAHKNGAVGFIAFGEGLEYERCAVGDAVLKLGDGLSESRFDPVVYAAICSNNILTPNTMDNLIWYLRKEP